MVCTLKSDYDFMLLNVTGLTESCKKLCYDTQQRHKICFINFISLKVIFSSTFVSDSSRHFHFNLKKAVLWLSFNESFVRSLNFITPVQPGKIKALAENYEVDKEP